MTKGRVDVTRGGIAVFFACLLAPLVCEGAPTLTATPETIHICPGASQHVRLVATDDQESTLASTTLRWQAAGNVAVSLEPVHGVPQQRGKYAAWLLKLTAPQTTPTPATVHVFLVSEPRSQAPQVLASTSFKVASAIATEAFPAKVELDSTWKGLSEGQRARAQAIIRNESATTLSVTAIRVSSGPFEVAEAVVAAAGGAATVLQKNDSVFVLPVANVDLAPGSAMVRAFDIFVDPQARPASGTHRLQVAVDLAGTLNGCGRAVTLVATRDLGFAVLGNESILTAVGIPSFLLMPGFLMLMACLLLWKFGLRPRRVAANAPFPFPPKETEFWVVAVTLSLLFVLVPRARDRFANYRIEDVAHAWFGSLVAAAVAYLIIVATIDLIDRIRNARLLSENDDVAAALRKVAKLTRKTLLTQVEVNLEKAGLGKNTTLRFRVPQRLPGNAWTLPRVVYDWVDAPDAATQEAIEAARSQKDLPKLVDVLLTAAATRRITFRWDPDAPFPRPVRVAPEALAEKGEAELVQESA